MKNSTVFLLLALAACGPKKLDTGGMAREMRDRQPKHVTPSQLATLADEWGRQLTDSLNRRLPASRRDTAQVGKLGRQYGAEAKFMTLRDLSAQPDPKVREVAAAYQYAAANRLPADPNLQKLDGGEYWLYTAPTAQPDSAGGFWTIRFSRKNIILRVDVKTLNRLKTPE